MTVRLTDTKSKRRGIIIFIVLAAAAAVAYFLDHGADLADRDADRVAAAATSLASSTSYEEAVGFDVEDLVLDDVEPGIIDDAVPGELVVEWQVQRWGARRCVTATWGTNKPAVIATRHC